MADQLGKLTTEERNARSAGLDRMSTIELLTLINEEDRRVPEAIAEALPAIARAVDLIVARLSSGGALLYVGAGTSGRLGIVDAAECLPTFGVGPGVVSAVIAGGDKAVFRAVEESEDNEDAGGHDVSARVSDRDVVVGISASGVTPYVRGALRAARRLGAATVAIVCNHVETLDLDVDVRIQLLVGPEVLTGSTRMKAGTAQKMVLNMLSTASMTRLGKVFDNLMVDMQPTNRKLRARSVRIVAMAAGLGLEESENLLVRAGDNIKTAIVMALAGTGRDKAEAALAEAKGHTRAAIESLQEGRRYREHTS